MDRKARHEQFVSGLQGGTVCDVYAVAGICALGVVAYHFVARAVGTNVAALQLADYVFNWGTMLFATVMYANKLPVLAALLLAVAGAAFLAGGQPRAAPSTGAATARARKAVQTNSSTKGARDSADKPDSGEGVPKVAYRPFLTIYRSAMMVLTCTAILAVDFPAFPRRFAKTETWGTSLMDLGVGSFVFSMGVVSSRAALRQPRIAFRTEAASSVQQTAKVLALGLVRLIMVKQLDYQEHESEYGVHWNFFFTLGLLPLAFVLLRRLPPASYATKATILALGYEIALKNTGLLEWALAAPRTTLVSQNKEGITSFAGYLAIFSFGYAYGLRLMAATTTLKSICITSAAWATAAQLLFSLLRVATEPSRRLANLPYIAWVVAFNTGFLGIFAAGEYLLDMKPSPSFKAVNSFGESVFVLANIGTGIVNLATDTMSLSRLATQVVLVGYQLALMAAAHMLYSRRQAA